MFEPFGHPNFASRRFATRMALFLLIAAIIDSIVLVAGAAGYYFIEGDGWLDAMVNSALVMTGNGPAHPAKTSAGKMFMIGNAVVGVVVFAAVITVLLIPIFHRVLHVFHSQHREPESQWEKIDRSGKLSNGQGKGATPALNSNNEANSTSRETYETENLVAG